MRPRFASESGRRPSTDLINRPPESTLCNSLICIGAPLPSPLIFCSLLSSTQVPSFLAHPYHSMPTRRQHTPPSPPAVGSPATGSKNKKLRTDQSDDSDSGSLTEDSLDLGAGFDYGKSMNFLNKYGNTFDSIGSFSDVPSPKLPPEASERITNEYANSMLRARNVRKSGKHKERIKHNAQRYDHLVQWSKAKSGNERLKALVDKLGQEFAKLELEKEKHAHRHYTTEQKCKSDAIKELIKAGTFTDVFDKDAGNGNFTDHFLSAAPEELKDVEAALKEAEDKEESHYSNKEQEAKARLKQSFLEAVKKKQAETLGKGSGPSGLSKALLSPEEEKALNRITEVAKAKAKRTPSDAELEKVRVYKLIIESSKLDNASEGLRTLVDEMAKDFKARVNQKEKEKGSKITGHQLWYIRRKAKSQVVMARDKEIKALIESDPVMKAKYQELVSECNTKEVDT